MIISSSRPKFTDSEKREVLNSIFSDDHHWQAFFYACSSPTIQHELNRPSLRFAKGHIIETYIASILEAVGGRVVDQKGYDVVMVVGDRECRIECKFEGREGRRGVKRRLANKMGEGDGGHEFACDLLLFASPDEVNAIFSDEITDRMLKRTKDAVIISVNRTALRAGPRVSRATSALEPSTRTFIQMFEDLCRDFVDLTKADYLALRG